jgi:hypothetical protein
MILEELKKKKNMSDNAQQGFEPSTFHIENKAAMRSVNLIYGK